MPYTAPLMIWAAGPDGLCTFLSQSWCEFTGRTAAEGLGLGWLAAVHTEDRDPTRDALMAAVAGRAPLHHEYRLRRADGEYRWALDSAAPRLDEHGELLGFNGVLIDITERRRAEDALRRSEAKFAAAFHAGPVILSITRLSDGRFIEVNQSFLTASGYAREEVLGRTPLELGLWVNPAEHADGIRQLRAGLPMREVVATFRVRGGAQIVGLLSADVIDVDGEPCALTTLVDITERRRAESILERYHLLSTYTRDIVVFVRLDGTIAEANESALTAYGYTREELLALTVYDLRASPDAPLIADQIARADRGGVLFESVHRRRDGSIFPVEVSSVGADVSGERLLLSIVRDITERRAAQRRAQELYAAEQHARQMAERAVRARDQFLQVASHELKTPLTALLGNAQLLERRMARSGTLTEREQRSLLTIVDQARRLDQMISALLDVTRFEGGQLQIDFEPLDLAALLRRVVDEVRPALMRHTVQLSGPDSLALEGDALRLEQVFRNLLSNAIKYSPAGGRLALRLEVADGVAVVSVTDPGIGIPAESLPHLFERFFRVDGRATQQIEGTGLGLYVVKEIVALHGGSVAVQSAEGQGSTFTVRLPLARP